MVGGDRSRQGAGLTWRPRVAVSLSKIVPPGYGQAGRATPARHSSPCGVGLARQRPWLVGPDGDRRPPEHVLPPMLEARQGRPDPGGHSGVAPAPGDALAPPAIQPARAHRIAREPAPPAPWRRR